MGQENVMVCNLSLVNKRNFIRVISELMISQISIWIADNLLDINLDSW